MGSGLTFQTMYADNHGWMLGWFRRRLCNREQAADLTQDTFLKVLVTTPSETISNPRAFLTTLARQLLVDQFRRQQLEQAYLGMVAAMPEQQQPAEEVRAMVREQLRALDAMLSTLEPKICATLLLSQIEGLTYAQIAERLDVSERTVKRYMAQAFEACLIAIA